MASACYTRQQALTHLRNDPFHQVDDMRITSYAARYYLNPPAKNCPTTFPTDATTRIQYSGASWVNDEWKTDVESDLFNINRFGSRVRNANEINGVKHQYNPSQNAMNNTSYEAVPDSSSPQVFNKLTNPPCTLRATGWNRWIDLPHQPQNTYETPFDYFIPSRDLDKERRKTH